MWIPSPLAISTSTPPGPHDLPSGATATTPKATTLARGPGALLSWTIQGFQEGLSDTMLNWDKSWPFQMLPRLSRLYHLMPHSDPAGLNAQRFDSCQGWSWESLPKMHLPTIFGNSLLRKVMEALETQPSQDDATIWFHSMKPLTLKTKTRCKPVKKHGKTCRNDFQIQYRARCWLSACCCKPASLLFHVKDNQISGNCNATQCFCDLSQTAAIIGQNVKRMICTSIQVIRVQTLRVRSGGLWSAFAAKGFKANGNVPLPCLIFVQKKTSVQIKPRFQKLQWLFRLASSLKVLPQWGPWNFGANKDHYT